ncbi:hypothetical protein [Sphingomonas sp.]|jgi:predicted flap endonuclease-1-like 5' DNA nuclease|uniref:hypothetical protein n=1 Tax=Sphingomonas sp. TaxID=28214 RepID=UPI002D7E1515|nr:hypothetical protein [Sphingomonas sp.]HEU0043077.1 hypothetical protein [Sphingomonas sp.]
MSAAPTTASTPGASLIPESTDLFTAGSFAVIAVLALLAILGIIYGARQRRRRREGEREIAAHNAEILKQAAPPPVEREAAPRYVPPAAPVPPPLDDGLVVDTPAREPLQDESIAAATPALAENPAAAAAPLAPSGPSPADGPITQLKGLGPKVAALLAQHGITTVGQMAALTDDEAQSLDAHLGPFTGRMGRDRWQEQARFLAAGDRAGFEAVFGRL